MAKRTGGFIGQDGINAPDPATGVTGTAGDTSVSVAFTAPSDVGGAAITGYNVQAADGSGTWQSSYDLGTASYDNVSVSVAAQDTNPHGIFFKTDGTKMYIIDLTGDDVTEYSLSTAWDITTASYSQSFSVAAQETGPQSLFFKPDGTKMYITGYVGDDVNEYSLSSAWDVSTASYAQNFSYASQDSIGDGLSFKSDGTKMYILGSSSDSIHEYNLSSAWDISSATFVQSFSVASEDPNPTDLFFRPDGLSFYVIGFNGDDVNEYSLSSAWDVSTASYVQNFSFASQDTVPRDIFFNPDGTKMFLVGGSAKAVYQYTSGLSDYPTASPVNVTGLTNGTSYTFNVWAINPFGWSSPSDASAGVTPAVPTGTRALFGPSNSGQSIDTVLIPTTGNATDWGDLGTVTKPMGLANATRLLYKFGEVGGSKVATIEYTNWSGAGGSFLDFGDISSSGPATGAGTVANDTRGLFASGVALDSSTDTTAIEYVTIASTGNTTSFGNVTVARRNLAGFGSTTRGIFAGGRNGSGVYYNVMDYVTIGSTGNATDFGDMNNSVRQVSGFSSSTRGCIGGGYLGSAGINNIDYVTIASTGNATDFGDLLTILFGQAAASSATRGLFAGGQDGGFAATNTIQYITIAATGNATDFGDLTETRTSYDEAGVSNAHGGLS